MGLIKFSIAGLERSYLPDRGRFAFRYKIEEGPDDTDPRLACKYTLNTLLGLKRAKDHGFSIPYDLPVVYERTCTELRTLTPQAADLAMVIWCAFELGLTVPVWGAEDFTRAIADSDFSHMQDLAWTLYAICMAHQAGELRWDEHAHHIARRMIRELQHPDTGLFYFRPHGIRKQFSSFAGPVYASLALSEYSLTFGDIAAETAAAKGICAIVDHLQGPLGQWAWFHDVETGRVMDWYPVYGVHQDSMAPMVLLRGMELGVAGAQEALVKGFHWLFGENELRTSMVHNESRNIFRAVARRGPAERPRRLLNAYWRRSTGNEASCELNGTRLRIVRECRSYHLGWILWTFVGVNGFQELLDHPQFAMS